ncbi:unnamed protein product, partial [marine sediment metagenome]
HFSCVDMVVYLDRLVYILRTFYMCYKFRGENENCLHEIYGLSIPLEVGNPFENL